MFSYFRKKQATMCGVVIDIGSGSVGASILLSNHRQQVPEIVYSRREFMPVRGGRAQADRTRHMRHALFTVMLDLAQKGIPSLSRRGIRRAPQRVLVSCTAPWSQTATQIIHYAQDEPFEVTEELVERIIEHAYQKEKDAQGKEQEELLKEFDMQVIEHSVVDVMLNGYHTEDPYGKKALEVDVAHLRGFVPNDILTALADIEKNILSNLHIQTHTSALILYCVLRDMYPNVSDALIVDISGEATELSIMHDDVLYESSTVPYGLNTLTRDVAKLFKTVPEETRTYIRAYKRDTLTATQEKTLLRAQKTYAAALESGLDELTARYVLPKTVFLVLDQHMQPFFTELLNEAVAQKGGHVQKTIIPLAPDHTYGLASVPQDTPIDARLALTARFFHKLHACGEID